MLKTAIFPGTFDPFTLGHYDVAKRAMKLCDHLIIAVGNASQKSPLIPFKQRIQLIQQSLDGLGHVAVMELKGLLVDFAKDNNAQAIIRGIRNGTDFAYEEQLAQMNHQLNPEIETIFLTPRAELAFISSTLVRDVIHAHSDIAKFVPPAFVDHFNTQAK